jgi:hypothetical protein
MARRKKLARRHQVKASMQVLELNNAGSSMELEVFEAGEKLGRIVLGRGSITWIGKNRQKSKRWSWDSFAKIMNKHAYGDDS